MRRRTQGDQDLGVWLLAALLLLVLFGCKKLEERTPQERCIERQLYRVRSGSGEAVDAETYRLVVLFCREEYP